MAVKRTDNAGIVVEDFVHFMAFSMQLDTGQLSYQEHLPYNERPRSAISSPSLESASGRRDRPRSFHLGKVICCSERPVSTRAHIPAS
jgi:hypothetical protein